MAGVDQADIVQWLAPLKLSRPITANLVRDFQSGILLAEVLHLYFPKTINLVEFRSEHLVERNWRNLNRAILGRLRAEIMQPQIELVAQSGPGSAGVVLTVLDRVKAKVQGRPIVGTITRSNRARSARDAQPPPPPPTAARRRRGEQQQQQQQPQQQLTPPAAPHQQRGGAEAGPGSSSTRARSASGRRPVVRPMRTADAVLSAREKQRRDSRERDALAATADTRERAALQQLRKQEAKSAADRAGVRAGAAFGGGQPRASMYTPLSASQHAAATQSRGAFGGAAAR
eukprot:g2511.t1